MYLDSLDGSPSSLQHQTETRRSAIRSKCLYVSIGLCIIFSLAVAAGFIIKIVAKSPQKLGESISERL